MTAVRIATRRSDLALWQARHVAARIEAELGRETELLPMLTTGDRLRDVSLAQLGGKGLFVKEIEAALLERRADLAVHSAKDLPAESPDGLCLVAIPPRADPRDALVSPRAGSLAALPRGARVGTGSVRRRAQLARARPDLVLEPLRGNVPTRLGRLDAGELDAVVLASAGLDRLGMAERVVERLDPETLLPAVGQGTLALQARSGDGLAGDLAALDDADAAACLSAERACLSRLGADCTVPLGGFAEIDASGELRLRARLFSLDGATCVSDARRGKGSEAETLGRAAAEALLDAGGEALLAELRQPA